MEDQNLAVRYRALLLAARKLFQLGKLDDIVEQILHESTLMLQAEACSMYLPDYKTRELIIYSARGHDDALIHSSRIPWDKGVAGSVFHDRKFVRIDDAQQDPRFFRALDSRSGFVTRAMLCMPLVDKEKCFGVLQALNPTSGGPFSDLDQEIFEGLGSVVTSALLRFDMEQKAVAEARLARELSLAREIQQSFLPPRESILPRIEMRVRYQPARTIGGDFYAAISLDDNRFLAAIGDVSGKGIPAALTTAQVMGELTSLAPKAKDGLGEYVRAINQRLCGRLAAGRFIATTFLLYDPNAAMMEVVCAGQFAPWRWKDEKCSVPPIPSAVPLGVMADYPFQAERIPCEPGEKWFLFSDGITEGRNPLGEEYGAERLEQSLRSSSPARVIQAAWDSWHQFIGSDELHDDACMALLSCMPDATQMVSASPSSCKGVRAFIEQWSLAAGFPDLERGQIVLAVDEAFTNILRHTYGGETGHKVSIAAEISDGEFTLRLRDFGPPIDPARLQGRAIEDVKPGGLGLHFIKTTFQTATFEPTENGTLLTLAKPLP